MKTLEIQKQIFFAQGDPKKVRLSPRTCGSGYSLFQYEAQVFRALVYTTMDYTHDIIQLYILYHDTSNYSNSKEKVEKIKIK